MNYLYFGTFFYTVVSTKGFDWTCIIEGYHQCDGFDKCCHDSAVCVGEDACLAIGAIVGICITAVVGMVTLVVVIYLCKRQKKPTIGTVFSQPTGTTTVTTIGRQQAFAHPQFGQQQSFAQPQFGQPTAFTVQQQYMNPLPFTGIQPNIQQQQNHGQDPVYPPPT